MTDQIYYKIQYPLKKAIEILKKEDENNKNISEKYSEKEIKEIKTFLENWENEGREKLKDLVKDLKDYNQS